jgi:flagellar export protein FliJ
MPRDRRKTYNVMFRVRKLEEEARARDMSLAHQAAAQGHRMRAALEQTRQQALEEAAERLSAPEIDASDMRAYYQYERHLARAIDTQDAENRKLDRKLAEERARLHAAAVRRRVMERLGEREAERLAKEAAQQEQKQLDEAAIVRALMAARKGGVE